MPGEVDGNPDLGINLKKFYLDDTYLNMVGTSFDEYSDIPDPRPYQVNAYF